MPSLKKLFRNQLRTIVWKLAVPLGIPIADKAREKETRELIEGFEKYGFFQSRSKQKSIDQEGNPIPWINYSAVGYLKQLDFSDKEIFEPLSNGRRIP